MCRLHDGIFYFVISKMRSAKHLCILALNYVHFLYRGMLRYSKS